MFMFWSCQISNIFENNNFWSTLLNYLGDVPEKCSTHFLHAFLKSRLTKRLAREAGAHDVATINAFRNMLDPFSLINVSTGGLSDLPDVIRKTPDTRQLVVMGHKEISGQLFPMESLIASPGELVALANHDATTTKLV